MLYLLFLVFLVLKLMAVIDWHWFWIFAPLFPYVIIYGAILIAFIVTGIIGIFDR